MNKKFLIFSIAFFLGISSIGSLGFAQENTGNILYIGGSGEGNYSSIKEAIDEALSGDTIFLYNNIYIEPVMITKPLYFKGEDKYHTIIDGNFIGNTIHITSDNVTLEGITIRNSGNYSFDDTNSTGSNSSTNNGGGLQIVEGGGVSDNILTMPINYAGIFSDSNNVHISSCIIEQNYVGIVMRNGTGNQVNDCQIQENNDGLNLYYSTNCNIEENVFSQNINGLYLYELHNSEIHYCTLDANDANGMTIAASDYNQIHMNEIMNNSIGMVIINDCIGNVFYQNNFAANTMIHVSDTCMNTWDNGLVGNYWDDYTGIDANDDGIGDSPYEIQVYSTDKYPYINPVSLQKTSTMLIQILLPGNNEKVSGTVLIQGTVIDDNEVQEVLLRIDEGGWMPVEGLETWESSLNTSMYENGDHTIYVSAINSDDFSALEHISIHVENINGTDEKEPVPDETPGFHILFVLMSIMMVLFIMKKKNCNT